MSEKFHYEDSNGQKGTIEIHGENEEFFNALGIVVIIVVVIGSILSLFLGGLADVYKYCEGIMLWMMIIEVVITAFMLNFNAIIAKFENIFVLCIITGVISAIIHFLIMLFTIRANTALGFFNVFGAIMVALFEAFLATLAGLIVGTIIILIRLAIRAIIKAVKGDEDGKNEDDEVV